MDSSAALMPMMQALASMAVQNLPDRMGPAALEIPHLCSTFAKSLVEFLEFQLGCFSHNRALAAELARVRAVRGNLAAEKTLSQQWYTDLMFTATGARRPVNLVQALREHMIGTVVKSDHRVLKAIQAKYMYLHPDVTKEDKEYFVARLKHLNALALMNSVVPDGMFEYMQVMAARLVTPGMPLTAETMAAVMQGFMGSDPDMLLAWTTKLTESLSGPDGVEVIQSFLDMPSVAPILRHMGMEGAPGLAGTLSGFLHTLKSGIATATPEHVRSAMSSVDVGKAKEFLTSAGVKAGGGGGGGSGSGAASSADAHGYTETKGAD
jgi:hypothetical protein